jgi:membrane protease YdiL (CAAX protease family)
MDGRATNRWSFFREPFHRAHEESHRHVADGAAVDWKVIVVLLTTAVSLTLQQYVFGSGNVGWVLEAAEWDGDDTALVSLQGPIGIQQDRRLAGLMYWAVGTVVTYAVIPALVITCLFRERLRNYGLRLRGTLRSSWTYLVMFATIFPCILYFSTTAAFQAKYPFYKLGAGEPLWPRFWIWELFYAAQFVALEFFFRGFVLHGTRRRFGFYAIFVMMVPYCMIHFGKPMPETFGAIGAGIILGFMSLKTRSIWLGAAVHVAVALSMDLLALSQKGLI